VFYLEVDSYSNLEPEPESYVKLLVALRRHSLLNPLKKDLFDKVVYCSLLYDLSATPETLDILNDTIDQATWQLSYLVNPGVEEEAIPEDYEDDLFEEKDPALLARYILLSQDRTTVRLNSEEEYVEDSISSSSSYSSPSSLLESRVGDESWVAWWEGWNASHSISLKTLSSPSPLQTTWTAWPKGGKSSPTPSSNPNPSPHTWA